jgi:chromate transporter
VFSKRRARWQIATAGLVMAGMLLNVFAAVALPVGLLLLLAGLCRLISNHAMRSGSSNGAGLILPPLSQQLPLPLGLAAGASAGATGLLASLFSVFFKAGLLVFGGGLVIIPLLERQVVELGWLDPSGFLDGVAIGQISPGPVVLTSSFVGYQAGWAEAGLSTAFLGAAAATLGIFLPSFLFILVGTPILQRLRRQPQVQTFLSGLTAGVPGAVAGAAMPLTLNALQTGAPLIQIPLFCAALSLSVSNRMQPLPLIGITLLIGVLYGWLT